MKKQLLNLILFSYLVQAQDLIYWGNEGSGEIKFGNITGGVASTFIGSEAGPCGVAIDSEHGKIYWANFNGNTIKRADLNDSSTVETVYTDDGSLCGIATDSDANKIYWANFDDDEIWSSDLDGSNAVKLFDTAPGDGPSGVAIDPANNKIYWTNQLSGDVYVGNLDGTGVPAVLFSAQSNPLGVAIDVVAQKLYWTNLNSGEIMVGDSDGSSSNILFSGENRPGGLALDPDEDKIYWASFQDGEIRVGDLDGIGIPQDLFTGQSSPLFAALLKKPQGIMQPMIIGKPRIGKTLTCTGGTWAEDLLGAFLYREPQILTYSWYRDGVLISGANAPSYVPKRTGKYQCGITGKNYAGSDLQQSCLVQVICY